MNAINIDSDDLQPFLPWLAAGVAAVCGFEMLRLMPADVRDHYSRFGWALSSAFLAYVAYSMVRTNGLTSWIRAFLFIAAVSALFSFVTLGTHAEGDDDSVGETVIDFRPTTEERALNFANGVVVMLWGAYVGTRSGPADA